MTIIGYRRAAAVLSVASVILLIVIVALALRLWPLEIRVMMAHEQIQLFDEMHQRAMHGSASEIAESMRYVVSYYPSGTKQIAGSLLDQIVEQARAATIRDLIDHLRQTTGEDLGDAAEPWIQKFGTPR